MRIPERQESSALSDFVSSHRRVITALFGLGAFALAGHLYHKATPPTPVPALARDAGTNAPKPHQSFLAVRFAKMMPPPSAAPLSPETDDSKDPGDYIRQLKDFVIERDGDLWSSSLGIAVRQLEEWYQENYLTPWEWMKIIELIEKGDYDAVDTMQGELNPVVHFRYRLRNARSQGYISEDEEARLSPMIRRDNLVQTREAFDASFGKVEAMDVYLNHTAEAISIGLDGYAGREADLQRVGAMPMGTPEELDAKYKAVQELMFGPRAQVESQE